MELKQVEYQYQGSVSALMFGAANIIPRKSSIVFKQYGQDKYSLWKTEIGSFLNELTGKWNFNYSTNKNEKSFKAIIEINYDFDKK